MAWFFSIVSAVLVVLTEMVDFGDQSKNFFYVCEGSVGLAALVVLLLSVYNFFLSPPNRIFITYEKFLRLSLDEYFKELN
jgi:hypothetical protein